MQSKLRLIVVLGIVGAATSVGATTALMQKLPVAGRFACLNCHVVPAPTSTNPSLNVFGVAFQNNGSKWDRTIAQLRSDSDICTNGFELGDEDGDGRTDTGVTEERSNPGQSDCTLELTPQAWSALKTLFR